MSDVIRYTATVKVDALTDGVNTALLPKPVTYYLAGEPGTDGYDGHWVPQQRYASEFLDEIRLQHAIDDAHKKARTIQFSSVVTIHKKIIHTEVIWDPPLSSPTS